MLEPAEFLHRIIEQLFIKLLYIKFRLGLLKRYYRTINPKQHKFCSTTEQQLPTLPFAKNQNDHVKATLLEGKFAALGFAWQWSQSPDCWNLAPDTGHNWPAAVFFDHIDYRANNPYGDVRVAWEPARLQQLVELALLTNDDQHARSQALEMMADILESWVKENPPASGIHYISAMECALRILSVTHALDMVRPYIIDKESLWRAAALLVQSHADIIEKRLSLHSSIGNHTTAECVGLIYAAVLFPDFSGARRWLDKALTILRQEAVHQVLPDGGGVEGSPWYHAQVLDLFGLTEQLLSFHNKTVPKQISAAVARGKIFLSRLADSPKSLIRLNDADDGVTLSHRLRLSWDEPDCIKDVATFPDSGITRVSLGSDLDSFLILDHGPLGMPPIFSHAHADALSVLIRFRGIDLVVDPGTYMYTGGVTWREYFRSTAAHNTLCIDSADQADQATPFQWTRPYDAELIRSETDESGTALLLARHDGYSNSSVVHWRSVILVPNKLIIIYDFTEGSGTHRLDLHWHTAVNVANKADGLTLSGHNHVTRMSVQGGTLSLHKGETAPICGWQSIKYGEKNPITTIRASYQGDLPHEMFTTFELGNQPVSSALIDTYLNKVRSWLLL